MGWEDAVLSLSRDRLAGGRKSTVNDPAEQIHWDYSAVGSDLFNSVMSSYTTSFCDVMIVT